MRTRSRRTALVVTAALAAPLVVCAVLAPFRDDVANTNVALVLVLVVVGAAATGRRTAGIGAALSSGVWFDFFLTEPYHQLTITDRTDVETTVLLLLVGVSVTEIALWGRREQARSSRRVGFLAGFVSSARLVAAADTPPSVLITHVQRQIVEALDIDECRFDTATGGAHPRLHADGSVTSGGSLVDVERDGLPTGDRIELLIEHAGTVHGRFLLDATTRVRRPDVDQRVIAVTLAQLVGAALATPRSGDRRT
ncbi:DUF4118 domain-containing protein [Oerskovia sp. Sa2CUA9]|uniref:DUF4118 domain-containing protein n=2 Tax=Oerskovia merdavium TaxID=2762227 RepID=A0ABR8TXM0_9CELL|nr:DUF4118 domain-containing protein [Oerskovia merdavium]